MGTILLLILIIVLIGALPTWPHRGFGCGYWPSGGAGLLLLVVIVLLLAGRL